MKIKTFNPTFEIWELTDQQAENLQSHLTATLGNGWTLKPAEIINEVLRAYLFSEVDPYEPCDEIPGEGFMPTSITGENGFFEDADTTTLPEPAPEPAGPSVEFYDNIGQYFEYTDTDGETYTGRITHGEAFPWIDWGTCPDNWEQAEEFISQQFDNQPPQRRRAKFTK